MFRSFTARRPVEPAFLQTLVVEPESVMVPYQNFHFVFLPVAEDKKVSGEGIQLKVFLDDDGQAVNGFSKICGSHGQVHLTACC